MDRLTALYRQYELLTLLYGEKGAFEEIADIGADHGYLSLEILESGFPGKLIVTDVAELPLALARKNIGEHPRAEFRQIHGLDGDFEGTRLIFIAGMGGDLICEIVQRARSLREDVLFVLQPMTNHGRLLDEVCRNHRYLWSYFVQERGKHYRIVVAGGSRISAERIPTESVVIPFVADDFEGYGEYGNRTERVLPENRREALSFFRACLKRQIGITAEVEKSGSDRKMRRCAMREDAIRTALDILETSEDIRH